MAYRVLYRIYRPHRFADVVGQDVIVRTLQNAIKQDKIANAYLFCGPRGTGKTSVAKIFASAVNCTHFNGEPCENCENCRASQQGNHPDIIEFDAASYSRVESIREVLANIGFTPSLGRYKVYIIDEVHMLSNSAASALLKTLEEPPAHVIFILATTDPQKVLPTIQSRCQRYDFGKIEPYVIQKKMEAILKEEGIQYEENALALIASLAEGGMRDALSILEQCLAFSNESLKEADVKAIYGLSTVDEQIAILRAARTDSGEAIRRVREMYQSGIDIRRLCEDLIDDLKETLIYSDKARLDLLKRLDEPHAGALLSLGNRKELLKMSDHLFEALEKTRYSVEALSCLELALLKMRADTGDTPVKQPVKAAPPEEEPVLVGKPPLPPLKMEEVKSVAAQETAAEVSENDVSQLEVPEHQEEIPVEKTEKEPQELKYDLVFFLGVLLKAQKAEKTVTEEKIFPQLPDCAYEEKNRKFYLALKDAKILGSSADFILFSTDEITKSEINDPAFNRELYFFLKDRCQVDKMCAAIGPAETKKLIEMYRTKENYPEAADIKVERYQQEKEAAAAPREMDPVEFLEKMLEIKVKVED